MAGPPPASQMWLEEPELIAVRHMPPVPRECSEGFAYSGHLGALSVAGITDTTPEFGAQPDFVSRPQGKENSGFPNTRRLDARKSVLKPFAGERTNPSSPTE